jgi:hypothetical protein
MSERVYFEYNHLKEWYEIDSTHALVANVSENDSIFDIYVFVFEFPVSMKNVCHAGSAVTLKRGIVLSKLFGLGSNKIFLPLFQFTRIRCFENQPLYVYKSSVNISNLLFTNIDYRFAPGTKTKRVFHDVFGTYELLIINVDSPVFFCMIRDDKYRVVPHNFIKIDVNCYIVSLNPLLKTKDDIHVKFFHRKFYNFRGLCSDYVSWDLTLRTNSKRVSVEKVKWIENPESC